MHHTANFCPLVTSLQSGSLYLRWRKPSCYTTDDHFCSCSMCKIQLHRLICTLVPRLSPCGNKNLYCKQRGLGTRLVYLHILHTTEEFGVQLVLQATPSQKEERSVPNVKFDLNKTGGQFGTSHGHKRVKHTVKVYNSGFTTQALVSVYVRLCMLYSSYTSPNTTPNPCK